MRGTTYFLSGLATLAVTASAFAYDKIGVVGAANGSVTALRDGKTIPVKPGDAVYLNDIFETGNASEAQLIFVDRSTLSLTPHSKLTVDNYVYNPATKDGQMGVQGMKGVFRFVGGALSKQHPVSIKTPVATIGIRGGIAETNIADNGATDAVFVYGDALTMTNQKGETITTNSFGTGLQLATLEGTPTNLPGAIVAARLTDAAAGLGIGSTAETQKMAPSNSVDPNLNFGGDGSSSSSSNSQGSTNQSASTENGTSTSAETGTDSSSGTGAASATTDQAATSTTSASSAAFGTVTQPLPPVVQVSDITTDQITNAVRNDSNAVLPGTPPVTGNTPPSAPVPPSASVPPAQTNTATNNGGSGAVAAPANTHYGRYVLNSYNGSTWDVERGATASYNDGTVFNAKATPNNVADPVQPINLPVPTNPDVFGAMAGALAVNSAETVGQTDYFNVKWYNSYGNAMQYYRLNESDSSGIAIANGDQVNIIQGIRVNDLATARAQSIIADGAGLTASNVRFYNFLPELNAVRFQGNSVFGLFNYAQVAPTLVTEYGGSGSGNHPFGMGVDWQNGKYLAAKLNFDFVAENPVIVAAFGDVDNTGGAAQDSYLKGFAYRFIGDDSVVTGIATENYAGTNKVGKDIFANANGPIAGMVIDYSTDTTSGAVINRSGSQPAVLNAAPGSDLTDAVNQRTIGTDRGFAAGIIIEDSSTTPSPGIYTSGTSLNNVSVNKTASGNVAAMLTLQEDIAPLNVVKAKFGSLDGKANAYLGDNLYGAQQGLTTYSMDGGTTVNRTSTATNGVLLAGKVASATTTPQCTQCQYTHWGVWAGESKGTNNGPAQIDVAHMVPYVAGQVTPGATLETYYDYNNPGSNPTPAGLAAGMPLGDVISTYNGAAYANIQNGTSVVNAAGTSTTDINLSRRQVTGMTINVGNYSFNKSGSPVGISTTGDAVFANVSLVGSSTPALGMNGNANGALFGPKAEEVGGNFVASGGGKQAAGVFHGAR
ncbi:MAG: FecR family protein [Rickettsiales bacterium]